MDQTAGVRLGTGVFRPLLHAVDRTARPIEFHGVLLWFACCGAACVLVHEEPSDRRDRCRLCFG